MTGPREFPDMLSRALATKTTHGVTVDQITLALAHLRGIVTPAQVAAAAGIRHNNALAWSASVIFRAARCGAVKVRARPEIEALMQVGYAIMETKPEGT